MAADDSTLLVCPDFLDHHLDYLSLFEDRAVPVWVYDEWRYRRVRPGLTALKVALGAVGLRLPKRLFWDCDAFNRELAAILEADACARVLLVKPFLFDPAAHTGRALAGRAWIFHHYDVLQRFEVGPVERLGRVCSFDMNDCLKRGWRYCPVPNRRNRDAVRSALFGDGQGAPGAPRAPSVFFAGAFSLFRLSRLVLIRMVLGSRIHCDFHLVAAPGYRRFANWLRWFGVPIVCTRVSRPRDADYLLDIPHHGHQSGASSRSAGPTDILFSYDALTPGWRHLNLRTLAATFAGARRMRRIILSGEAHRFRRFEQAADH